MISNLRRESVIAILVSAFALVGACSNQKTKTVDARPQPDTSAQTDAKLWLNGEQFGTVADPSSLANKIRDIIAERKKNGTVEKTKPGQKVPDGYEHPRLLSTIYLRVDDNVPVGDVLRIYLALDQPPFHLIRKSAIPSEIPPKPNPNALVLAVGQTAADTTGYDLPDFDDDDLVSSELTFTAFGDDKDIQYARNSGGGIELLADGAYLVNHRYENPDTNQPIEEYPPKQEPLAEKDVAAEIARELAAANVKEPDITVIASPKAPFRSAYFIQQAAGNNKNPLHLIVYDPRWRNLIGNTSR